jgi:hypothetical protein
MPIVIEVHALCLERSQGNFVEFVKGKRALLSTPQPALRPVNAASAADLKFLHHLPQSRAWDFKSISGTRII